MKNALLLTLILLSQMTFSQIKVYTPDDSDTDTETNTYKWAVKTDVLGFIMGEFPIIAEYRVAKHISIEGSAGMTYSFWSNGNSFFKLDDESSEKTEAGLGTAFRLGFKYYPSSDWDAIEGWAFGIQGFTTTNNRNYKKDEYMTEDLVDSEKKIGAAITISKQIFNDSNISFEYFLGLGLASFKREYYELKTNYVKATRKYVKKEEDKSVPSFKFGIRIGFGN